MGAGRGPLVDELIEAMKRTGLSHEFQEVKITVLDKNPNAVATLLVRRQRDWSDHDVSILHGDIRTLDLPKVKHNNHALRLTSLG